MAEFGDPRVVAAGFGPELAAATRRRAGLGLLGTGPLVGSSWLLVTAASWRWSGREPPAALGLVAALVGLALVLAGGVAWPAGVVAAGASGVRLSRAGRAARRCLAARATLA